MNKARCLLWGNFLLFVFFIVQVITSAVLFFMELPKEQEHVVYLVHAFGGLVLSVLVIVHLALHWRMIKHVYFE